MRRAEVLDNIVREIDETEQQEMRGMREHLGASDLSSECDAFLNITFNWGKPSHVTGRVARILQRGKREEILFRERLVMAGFVLCDHLPTTFNMTGGHIAGECDGWVQHKTWREPLIVEYKTMNQSSFRKLEKHGVESGFRHYYAQMSIYGYMLHSPKVLFVAINKNDESIHIELVEIDKLLAKDLLARGRDVVAGTLPAVKISQSPDYYICKMCPFHRVCHGNERLSKNCRSCKHSEPALLGTMGSFNWKCGLDKDIQKFYKKGCESWSA